MSYLKGSLDVNLQRFGEHKFIKIVKVKDRLVQF